MGTWHRIAEDLAAAVVAVGFWELGRWAWYEVQLRRASRVTSAAFWGVVRDRWAEMDDTDYCPPAEGYEGEDYIS